MEPLSVGAQAPEFTLPSNLGDKVTLKEALAGRKAVVLAFFPLAFTKG